MAATQEQIAEAGFDSVSIAGVAQRAGVSRQTVYSIFGCREDLVSEAVADLTITILGDLRDHLSAATTLSEYVVELIVASRTLTRSNPVVSRVFGSTLSNPLFDDGMWHRAREVTRTLMAPAASLAPSVDSTDEIAEMALHLGLAVVVFDSDKSDEELREFLTRWLEPAIETLTQ
ncbi:TetR/AcrR family transcriptional regulator [Gordonia soli]|uniref:Putative TetR family transcriptional regulator n=1 Tax=Gordonia soli NBRC 108243 TaxID=1223545 RepID=M0QLE3_9ACTN|nr:TetR/AcrR family transcriptional regulator [Gordonia soli]GAC69475.1 putative TetR family transcriptional regulator [Gordonia soli NBRC 108243]